MFEHSSASLSRAGLVREPAPSYAAKRSGRASRRAAADEPRPAASTPSAREETAAKPPTAKRFAGWREAGYLSARDVETQLLAALKRVEAAQREAVSWFGEIVDRRLYRRFGCSSIQQYARERLGFSTGRTSEFLRLWEALRRLPQLKEAVESGKVGWTKACQVIRVATPETEAAWVEEARTLNRPSLRRKVDAVRGTAKRRRRSPGQGEMGLESGDGAGGVATAAPADAAVREVPVGMSLTFTPEQYARYEALVERARRGGVRGSREELFLAGLEALAGFASAGRTPGAAGARRERRVDRTDTAAAVAAGRDIGPVAQTASPRGSGPRYQVVIQVCETCGKATTPTTRGALAVTATTLAVALCDARVRHPGQRNRATIPPSTRREVLARDGYRCTSAGCRSAHFLHVHHVIPRSAGGSNEADNLVTLCGSCHRLVHAMESRCTTPGALKPNRTVQPAEAKTKSREHRPGEPAITARRSTG